jgi:hypothetical protein
MNRSLNLSTFRSFSHSVLSFKTSPSEGKKDIQPLFKKLKNHEIIPEQLAFFEKIINLCEQREYRQASEA